MQTKIIEIRDRATFIPVLCVDMNAEAHEERYYLRCCGYPNDGRPNILMTRADGNGPASNDPYSWGGRTYPVAHDYIINHWPELKSGDVVDVEFILGESAAPKVSERIR
jgi:hypothetical protein